MADYMYKKGIVFCIGREWETGGRPEHHMFLLADGVDADSAEVSYLRRTMRGMERRNGCGPHTRGADQYYYTEIREYALYALYGGHSCSAVLRVRLIRHEVEPIEASFVDWAEIIPDDPDVTLPILFRLESGWKLDGAVLLPGHEDLGGV